ncbi:MAG: HAMP domain-containing histidine kinase [Gemmataceae bacterium]|nr:HAMP domain-containing histidine kinase [Gemmataceae bacterium]
MSLATRLTGFFLLALAVVLAGFSGTLYVLARSHLYGQLTAHVTATIDTLVAAAEVEPDGLDWEPELRRLPARWEGDPPVWAVYDEAGGRLGGSHDPEHRLTDYTAPGPDAAQERFRASWGGADWRVARRTLRHPHPEDVRRPAAGERETRHRTLVFVTAVPVAPVHATLRALGWGLGGTSVVLWLAAAAVGRRLARRALSPLAAMSAAANALTARDAGGRLPRPGTGDELESLAEAFNGLLARLHDAFERQRGFTGEASHQLRTPLTAMLGQTEVALRRDRPAGEYRQALESVHRQAVHMRQIVEALLFLARADAEAELPGLEVIDLGAWVAQYLDGHPHDRRTDLRPAGPFPEGVRVLAHPAMLAQVVGNLIDNACKYSDPGTPVAVGVGREDGRAVVFVEDSGHGIPPADGGRVFDPFFRSEDARRRGVGGLGLGLAVVARIVRAFGGRVDVCSEPGRGSRFTVRLPLRAESVPRSSPAYT